MKRTGLMLGFLLLLVAPATQAGPPCSSKRVDPCGCHHVYGLRHCHSNRKTSHCELPAAAKVKPRASSAQASTTF